MYNEHQWIIRLASPNLTAMFLEAQRMGSLDQGVVHLGKAEEEGHVGAMVDDNNAAMRRSWSDEPEIPSAEPLMHNITIHPGSKAIIISNLLLPSDPTPQSLRTTEFVCDQLDTWVGGGVLLLAGAMFDIASEQETTNRRRLYGENGIVARSQTANALKAIDGHSKLFGELERFASLAGRRVVILRDAVIDDPVSKRIRAGGLEVMPVADLIFHTAGGNRIVHVGAGSGTYSGKLDKGASRVAGTGAKKRYIMSRLVYRRFSKYAWVLLVPVLLAIGLKIPLVVTFLVHLLKTHPSPRKMVIKAYQAHWDQRLAIAVIVLLAEILLFVAAVWWLARKLWKSALHEISVDDELPAELDPNDQLRSYAQAVCSEGYAGFVTGGSLEPELSYVGMSPEQAGAFPVQDGGSGAPGGGREPGDVREPGEGGAPGDVREPGEGMPSEQAGDKISPASKESTVHNTARTEPFFASAGSFSLVTHSYPARFGLPPVFVDAMQASWIELEGGAELRVRLFVGRELLRSEHFLERVLPIRPEYEPPTPPELVASLSTGSTWPREDHAVKALVSHRRAVNTRRIASIAIGLAGLADLASGVIPPLRERMHIVLQILPLAVAQAAGAFIILAGLSLLALARGIRRGQKNAYRVSVVVLLATLVFHLMHGGGLIVTIMTAGVLGFIVLNRNAFRASMNTEYIRQALLWLLAGCLSIISLATAVVMLAPRVDDDGSHSGLSLLAALSAVVSRLVGIHEIALPHRLDGFLSPALLATGIAIVVLFTWALTRPVVSKNIHLIHRSPDDESTRVRNIVTQYGGGTLDFFALRDDKSWFIFRNSVVAYSVINGVCVVSPDPIGPLSERKMAWAAFRQMADHHGWVIVVIGASEEWLPTYHHSGMHYMYIGDEGIVDVNQFSLQGNSMKGLRQAYNRLHNKGYTADIFELIGGRYAALYRESVEEDGSEYVECSTMREEIQPLLDSSRQGDFERGFSMMLGRVCDARDEGTLICVVKDAAGKPAALCHFVPAHSINGYSLDLMRWDKNGEHPNGLIDFALCITIFYLAKSGKKGLSLNFAAMRAVFEREKGDGAVQRLQYWAYKRMSSAMQMESLWKFNAKYKPEWYPRYVAYDSPEYALPVALACFRAEALVDFPIVGKVISATGRHSTAQH